LKRRGFRDEKGGDLKVLEGCRDLADTGGESLVERRTRAMVVHGAERFQAAGRSRGNEDVGAGALRSFEKTSQKFGGDLRHVASHDEVPIGSGVLESAQNSPQGALARIEIGEYGEVKRWKPAGTADQRGTSRGERNGLRHGLNQDASPIGQQGLVAAHSGTAAADQYVSRPFHTEMITLGLVLA
jgi:hypothetical protein